MTENLPQINLRHQITDPEGSEKSKQDKYKPNHPPKKTLHLRISFSYQKIKNQEQMLKEGRGKH